MVWRRYRILFLKLAVTALTLSNVKPDRLFRGIRQAMERGTLKWLMFRAAAVQ